MSTEDTAKQAASGGHPLEVLFEVPGLPHFPLPVPLAEHHGGSLGFPRERLFANFVSSADGVVALATNAESGHIISCGNEADRFVMGLLRACADAVMIGAGTFRKATGHLWQAGAIYPAGAAHFAEMRRRLGLRDDPTLVIVTASGLIDCAQPAIHDAIIVTIPAGETTLRARVPPTARILVLDGPTICLAEVVRRLHAAGFHRVLTEGGPSLFAALVDEHLVDELFLTLSPSLFGRHPNDGRKSLVNGLDLAGIELELLSVRRQGSHLFLRYGLLRPEA